MTRWTLLRRAVWLAGVAALAVAPLPAAPPDWTRVTAYHRGQLVWGTEPA